MDATPVHTRDTWLLGVEHAFRQPQGYSDYLCHDRLVSAPTLQDFLVALQAALRSGDDGQSQVRLRRPHRNEHQSINAVLRGQELENLVKSELEFCKAPSRLHLHLRPAYLPQAQEQSKYNGLF